MESAAQDQSTGKKQVAFLIVEDEKAHSRLINRYLDESRLINASVTIVKTLEQAREYLRTNSPDIMFVDVRLPDGQGVELLEENRHKFPVVVMTNFGNEQLAVDVLKLGALDYVVKSEHLFREIPQITIRVLREWDNLAEKQASQEALKRSEERFRQLAENINDIFWLFDPVANTMIYVSPAYEKIWGRSLEEIYRNPDAWIKAVHPDDQERAMKTSRSIGMQEDLSMEYRIINGKGETRWVRDKSKVIMDENGAVFRVAGITEDITERKLKDLELERYRNHLEEIVTERTKELESFCYSVSHDLRAPLRSIDGFSNILEEDYRDLLDEEGRANLQRIRNNIQKMAQLIDDLLLLSRVSRNTLAPETFSLSAMAGEICEDLYSQNSGRVIEFEIEPDINVTADANLLRIVMENLMANAVKFSGQVEKPLIQVGVRNGTENGLACFVKDNGVGFDMKYRDKLFMPFSRLHHASEFPGTGIGLATVKRIISRHNGKVWAIGNIDEGTTILFTLGRDNISVAGATQ
ncbi:MAG: PAS domain-containing protein [Gammaproteobacteria bacterium]|jgi:PAS domain S-box-containing protein